MFASWQLLPSALFHKRRHAQIMCPVALHHAVTIGDPFNRFSIKAYPICPGCCLKQLRSVSIAQQVHSKGVGNLTDDNHIAL